MAGSGHRVAALARACLRCQSGVATWKRAIGESAGIPRPDIRWLSNPWQASVRGISNSDGGENGEWQRLPPQNVPEPLQPVIGQGSNPKDVQSASEGQNLAGENGRSFAADGAAVQSQKTANSEGSVGISKPPASPNSEGPVDFGSRLSKLSEDDLDNLIAFKNFKGVRGLPPLETILGQDDEQEKKAKRREAERRKQEETKRSRVKQVDDLGRAYATGKRKTSIARVWLMEGQGNIIINGKTHDLYFLDMDKRVQLLEPFVITNTLGDFDVKSTVQGGGISGQSGALRHGISKALQLFDPALRPALKSEGMLTRDDRIVERKKPGKAKARKSFQWVKR